MEQNASLTKESLNQIIRMQSGTEAAARALYQLGCMELEAEDCDAATLAFRQVPPSWPEWHAQAGFNIADLYRTVIGDLDAATREYRKVIGAHPDSMSAACSYGHLAGIHAYVGDEVSAANMRESAIRLYKRIVEESKDPGQVDQAQFLLAQSCRELQLWEEATDAFKACRARAVEDKDASRRAELDGEIGLLLLGRELHDEAIASFREALDFYRRKADVPKVVSLNMACIQGQMALADEAGAKRSYRSLVDFISRSKTRLAETSKDPLLAPSLVQAYLAVEKLTEAKTVRTKLRRLKGIGIASALTAVEALIAAEERGSDQSMVMTAEG